MPSGDAPVKEAVTRTTHYPATPRDRVRAREYLTSVHGSGLHFVPKPSATNEATDWRLIGCTTVAHTVVNETLVCSVYCRELRAKV
jgi:hypothetical protein